MDAVHPLPPELHFVPAPNSTRSIICNAGGENSRPLVKVDKTDGVWRDVIFPNTPMYHRVRIEGSLTRGRHIKHLERTACRAEETWVVLIFSTGRAPLDEEFWRGRHLSGHLHSSVPTEHEGAECAQVPTDTVAQRSLVIHQLAPATGASQLPDSFYN